MSELRTDLIDILTTAGVIHDNRPDARPWRSANDHEAAMIADALLPIIEPGRASAIGDDVNELWDKIAEAVEADEEILASSARVADTVLPVVTAAISDAVTAERARVAGVLADEATFIKIQERQYAETGMVASTATIEAVLEPLAPLLAADDQAEATPGAAKIRADMLAGRIPGIVPNPDESLTVHDTDEAGA